MPHFFFDTDDGVETPDHTGEALPDVGAAADEAKRIAVAYAATPGVMHARGGTIVVRARAEAGAIVATVRLVLRVEKS